MVRRTLVVVKASQNYLFLCGNRGLLLWAAHGRNLALRRRYPDMLVWKCVKGIRHPPDLMSGNGNLDMQPRNF